MEIQGNIKAKKIKKKNKIRTSQPDFKTYYVSIAFRSCDICAEINIQMN